MQRLIDTLVCLIIIVCGGVYLWGTYHKSLRENVGAVVNQPLLTSMTNATTSIGRVPTRVFDRDTFHTYARISNTGPNEISCYLESATAASSTLVQGAGLLFGANSSTPYKGEPNICFGAAPGCVPYIGAVNCVMNVTTTVGIIYN